MPTTATNVYTYLSINVSVKTWQYNTLNISTSIFSLIASFVYNRFLIGKDLAIIPMLIMASRACPVGYESSMWATFFTFNDIAGTISGSLVAHCLGSDN